MGTETVTLAERDVLYSSNTGDAAVKAEPGCYCGFVVTVVTAVAAIQIRDSLTAGAGTVIDVIPSGTAAGTKSINPKGITCSAGLYIDYGTDATGTVVVLYG